MFFVREYWEQNAVVIGIHLKGNYTNMSDNFLILQVFYLYALYEGFLF